MHSLEETHELLVVGVEFRDLGLVKIEAEHPMPDFDNLLLIVGRVASEQFGRSHIP